MLSKFNLFSRLLIENWLRVKSVTWGRVDEQFYSEMGENKFKDGDEGFKVIS